MRRNRAQGGRRRALDVPIIPRCGGGGGVAPRPALPAAALASAHVRADSEAVWGLIP